MIRLAILEKEMQPNITRSMEVLILKTFLVSLRGLIKEGEVRLEDFRIF